VTSCHNIYVTIIILQNNHASVDLNTKSSSICCLAFEQYNMSTSHRGPDAKQYCSMSESKRTDLQATSLEMGGILSDCPKPLEPLFMWLRKKRNQSTLILNTETHRFPLFCLLKEKCSTFPPNRSRIDRLLKFLAPISRSAYISVGTERNCLTSAQT
jgi:hypothetical protein